MGNKYIKADTVLPYSSALGLALRVCQKHKMTKTFKALLILNISNSITEPLDCLATLGAVDSKHE